MTEPPDDLTVNRHDQLARYEGRVGTDLATAIEFVAQGQTVIITHTGTEPQWRGRGYAGRTTQAALDDIRTRGERVRPECPFTVEFMAAHPEYDDLRG